MMYHRISWFIIKFMIIEIIVVRWKCILVTMLGYVIVYASQIKLSVEGELVTIKTLCNDVEIKKNCARKNKVKWMCSNM